jgi:ATP-dependent exoDNAse (exonuclease V) alpha subunit
LLRHIRDTTIKNFAIVAPTAVAAINAGGVTLHSFFQIPFGPLVPDLYDETTQVRYSEEKIKLLKSLELLIVDEISMVRADLIDFIDRSLKNARGFNMPFGGVQVLMIGDLYQLPPIAHDAWHILKNYYNSPYFFDSRVLKNVAMVTFQLEKVYRQSDPLFLDILNGIREGQLAAPLLDQLNTRFDQDQIETFKDEYVTLTTHNHLVTSINEECLNQLKTETHTFKAMVTGDFPKDAFPVDELLQLKVGAQIMFIKNDSSGKKQFYNGRSAKIIQLSENNIKVSFTDDATELEVEREVWNNLKYNLNEDENRITEVNTGSFSQYPFKLAWAITIHKSQGLTFDKVIVDASSSFAHGQAYVALSRCRSLEGLILKAPLKTENIITDKAVISFTNQTTIRKPNESLLEACKRSYQWDLIRDVFNFELINQKWAFLKTPNSTMIMKIDYSKTLLKNYPKILKMKCLALQTTLKIGS